MQARVAQPRWVRRSHRSGRHGGFCVGHPPGGDRRATRLLGLRGAASAPRSRVPVATGSGNRPALPSARAIL